MTRWTLVFALAVSTAVAQPTDRLRQIADQQALLAEELKTGVLKVAARDAASIRDEQRVVFDLLSKNPTLADMSVEERVRLDNALQRINALVVSGRAALDDRRVCRSERATGSNVRKLTCRTQAEWDDIREQARLYKMDPQVCIPPGCGATDRNGN